MSCRKCGSINTDPSNTPGIDSVCLDCGDMVMSDSIPFQYEDGSSTIGDPDEIGGECLIGPDGCEGDVAFHAGPGGMSYAYCAKHAAPAADPLAEMMICDRCHFPEADHNTDGSCPVDEFGRWVSPVHIIVETLIASAELDITPPAVDLDPMCICGVAKSEHGFQGCDEGFQSAASWKIESAAIAEMSDHEFEMRYGVAY